MGVLFAVWERGALVGVLFTVLRETPKSAVDAKNLPIEPEKALHGKKKPSLRAAKERVRSEKSYHKGIKSTPW